MRKPSLHEEQDNPGWRTRLLDPREHPPLRVGGIGEPVHGVWEDTMNSRILRLRVEAGSQPCMPNPPTYTLTNFYPLTHIPRHASKLHASCMQTARARTHEGEEETEREVDCDECEAESEDEAECDDDSDFDGDCDGSGQPAAGGQEPLPPSCFLLVARRLSLPAVLETTMSFVISSVRLRPGRARNIICTIENMPRIHVEMICPN